MLLLHAVNELPLLGENVVQTKTDSELFWVRSFSSKQGGD
ncbi:hypothetical protein HNP21_004031 [Bacillus aryabhattai]|uniref:Uncharacterized protein n=1 Tax=Priestia aryabhattai TaxID=412384 RepID=A0A7W3RG19_PRIAR|nr:hypothetical protein [Priestia aryabhattai]MDH6652994.1 hypothetical protein [Bacillus sp. PvP124]MDP9576905.1 hypothetical protein [Bacillus sp. 1751]MDP9721966.1 hypothetical protein [Priestia aryabhattai]MDR7201814.1 hypothetical protein [Priestia megaterium]